MKVTNGIAELAVVDAVRALKAGCVKEVAVRIGVECAAAATKAHFTSVAHRERPCLRLVSSESEEVANDPDLPPPDLLWHSPWTYAVLAAAAALLAGAVVLGMHS